METDHNMLTAWRNRWIMPVTENGKAGAATPALHLDPRHWNRLRIETMAIHSESMNLISQGGFLSRGASKSDSLIFDLFLQAAKNRDQIVCSYNGLERELCPHVIGWGKIGEEKALGYQFAGLSSSGVPPTGEWRCFTLKRVLNARIRPGAWHTGFSHLKPQTCVKQIEFEVIV
jgi:hypothetical protein